MREQDLPRWRQWRRTAYFRLTQAVLLLNRLLPDVIGVALCRMLVRLAVLFRPRERARAQVNIRLAFPELDDQGNARLFQDTVSALGRNLHQTMTLADSIDEQLEGVHGAPAIAEIDRLRQQKRGVLILTGHIGCWELLGAFLARQLGELGVVTGTIHNRRVDELVQGRRVGLGMTVLPRSQGIRPVIRLLRAGGVVAVLLDQTTRVSNQSVPFFGRPVPTPSGFARLALRYRIPVLPVCIGRSDTGHEVQHLEPLVLPEQSGESAVQELLIACNQALETMIRRNSSEWVWFHRRWTDDAEARTEG